MFTTYVAPTGRLINSYGFSYRKYADETQIYTALVKPPENDLFGVESCTAGLQHWFPENDLLLNPDKSKVCFFDTGQNWSRAPLPPTVTVVGCLISSSDKQNTFRRCSHIRELCQTRLESMQLRHVFGLRHIRSVISRDAANTMTACVVGTRLDYCNALLHGSTEKPLNELQSPEQAGSSRLQRNHTSAAHRRDPS